MQQSDRRYWRLALEREDTPSPLQAKEWITTAGVDGLIEPIEKRPDFSMTDEEFKALAEWYLAFSEKRELLGTTNHLLYICRKQA